MAVVISQIDPGESGSISGYLGPRFAQINAALLASDAAMVEAQAAAIEARDAAQAAAAAAALAVGSAYAPQDAGTAALVGSPATATRSALDGRYATREASAVSASARGVVGDGVANDAPALNDALIYAAARSATLLLPPGGVLACTSPISVPSGSRIVGNGATIRNGIASTTGRVLVLSGVSDVVITDLVIDGRKADYAPATEWRHNVHIVASSRITLRGMRSINAKGDGFYVGDDSGASSDVRLVDCVATGNHRQGLTVSAVDGLVAVGCRFGDSSGVSPQSGVDIEPNVDSAIVRGVVMVGCTMSGSVGYGLSVALRAAPAAPQMAGAYLGCRIVGNTAGGAYLNNARGLRMVGGSVSDNGGRGVWMSTSTAGVAQHLVFSACDISRNAGVGVRCDQPFADLMITGCTIADNTGIGVDILPTAASTALRWLGNWSGNDLTPMTQTHGIRTGSNVSGFTSMANSYGDLVTAPTSLADGVTTRTLLDLSNRPTITGSRGGNAALASLLTTLGQRGVITDSTTA